MSYTRPPTRRSFRLWSGAVLLLTLASFGAGCNVFDFGAYVLGGDPQKKVNVKAQYRGLENKSFAVLVSADEYTMFAYPDASAAICRTLSQRLAIGVPGAKPLDPNQIVKFQIDNPYWNTVPYEELIQRLKVQRLVVVDLVQFSLHEPGNEQLWQGQMVANVGIAEAESANPSNFVFASSVRSVYPPDASVGVTDSDDKTIRLGLTNDFSLSVLHLFRDHEETQQ